MSVELAASVAAAWHASWLRALGLRSEFTDRAWRALDEPPFIYWTAVTLSPDAGAEDLRDRTGTVCDSWSSIDLAPFGFDVWAEDPWCLREPGPLPDEELPVGLEVVRVRDAAEVEEFESVAMRGFNGESATVEAGSIHPATGLEDPRTTMLTGRVDGRAVAAAMSYRTDDGVGIFGVTTLESMRGRGYASALTRLLVDPNVPAVLSPSAMAASLYRRVGFTDVGALRMWQRR